MLRSLCFIVLIWLLALPASSQNTADSLAKPVIDSIAPVADSTPAIKTGKVNPISIADNYPLMDSFSMRPPKVDSSWLINGNLPFSVQVLRHHPYFNFVEKPVAVPSDRRIVHGKEAMFYVLMGLLLVFALLKQSFGKYFNDLFRVFFRTTMKQRQIREQLMQTQFPSLVFNMFFVASTGLYIDFMLHYFNILPIKSFWLLYLYCCIGLAVIYFGKFIGLKVIGWLLNMKKAADSYIFIVFIINKVIGIFLLPFLILIAFANDPVYSISLVVSWCGIAALLIYRFILGFAAIRNEVRFNLFHFFLYLCAFEIIPLLLIYKLLLLIF
ncbi:MAG: DUF4271 domain-containing protein [Chitinophagaceae bacterium]